MMRTPTPSMQDIEKKRTWGLLWWDEWRDEYLFRHVQIDNPYQENEEWKITINEKFCKECIEDKVHKIVLHIGQREQEIYPPSKTTLKQLKRLKEYTDKPSMFTGSPAMRLYKIRVETLK